MPDQVDWRSMERDVSPGRAVGRLLRDQRIARDLSVDDVAARLRIRSRYLEAIEQGRFDQLPGAAYIPAFLRAYANHLGLDADKVMTAYQLSGPVPIERPVTPPIVTGTGADTVVPCCDEKKCSMASLAFPMSFPSGVCNPVPQPKPVRFVLAVFWG